jgi:transmembrane sensor
VRSWREQAGRGEYDAAYEVIEAEPAVVRDVPADLLLAADVARLSGHPKEALRYLRELTRDHAADPRAPLAAFTAGRVLLSRLGRPDDAARAFADARALSPRGSLAEDAWAREVQALAAAGRAEDARRTAEAYLAAHPEGRRARTVRRAAGIVPD